MSNGEYKEIHDSYMHIRVMLNAFDTQRGGIDRFEVTERKLKELILERDKYRNIVDLLHNQLVEINEMLREPV